MAWCAFGRIYAGLGVASAALVLALGSPAAGHAATPCWRSVIADWADGHVDGAYPERCYRQAIRNLPEDLRTYSSAADDITRALLQSRRPSDAAARSRQLAEAHDSLRPGRSRAPAAAVVLGFLGGVALVLLGTSSVAVAVRRRRRR